MIDTNDLRHEVSQIIGYLIPENGFKATFKELNETGHMDMKIIIKIMVVVLEHLDKLESKV
jgi:hypothetical protein